MQKPALLAKHGSDCRPSGKTTSPDAWKKQLAEATGLKHKRKQQQDETWQDTTGVYDTDGNLLSIEDYAEDDNDDLDHATDTDEWSDDFDDNEGLVEDQEIFNMDTGWSIEDFVANAPEAPPLNSKVSHFL